MQTQGRCAPRSSPSPLRIFLASLGTTLFLATSVAAQNLHQSAWVPDGQVSTVNWYNDRILFGGDFHRVGPPTGGGAITDRATGALTLPALGVGGTGLALNGIVRAVIPDGSGGWFVGGYFSTIGGVTRHNLAQVDASGNVTAWAPEPDGFVHTLHLYNGQLYVGGTFGFIGGAFRSSLASLSPSTGTANAWNPGTDGEVRFLGQFAGLIYAGGSFANAGGSARGNVAGFDPASGALNSWNVSVNGPVNTVFRSGTNIALGGLFTTVQGQARQNLAIVNTSGTVAPVATNANGEVHAFATNGTDVYVVGDFTNIIGSARQRLAAFDLATGTLRSWNPGADARVRAIVFNASQFWVAGEFANAGGAARNGGASLVPGSNLAQAWNPNAAGPGYAVGVDATRAFLGGDFFSVGWVAREHVASLDVASGSPTYGQADSWNPGVIGFISPVVIVIRGWGGFVFIGGEFIQAGGQPRTNFAALVGDVPNSWAPAVNGPVDALDVNLGPTLWMGGFFNSVGGQETWRFTGVDIGGGVQAPFQDAVFTSGNVLAVKEHSSAQVFVGGQFNTLRGTHRNGVGCVDPSTGLTTAWNPIPDDSVSVLGPPQVFALESRDGVAYVGGVIPFGTVGRENLFGFDAQTGQIVWTPNPNGSIFSLKLDNNRLYVAGLFNSIQGLPRTNVASFQVDTQRMGEEFLSYFNPTFDEVANTVDAHNGLVAVGGFFKKANGRYHPFLALLDDSPLLVGVEKPRQVLEGVSLSPNPVQAQATLHFALATAGPVTVRVFDVQGREVARPAAAEWREAGANQVRLDAAILAPGLYWYRLEAAGRHSVGKVIVVR